MSDSPFTTCPTSDKNISELQSAGYVDSTGNLVAAYDAATVKLGSPWRMPTEAEILALISNCTTTWSTTNGVNGRLVKGTGNYKNRSIFLPASGCGYAPFLQYPGSKGYFWASTANSNYSYGAIERGFSLDEVNWYNNSRNIGLPVRPVRSATE